MSSLEIEKCQNHRKLKKKKLLEISEVVPPSSALPASEKEGGLNIELEAISHKNISLRKQGLPLENMNMVILADSLELWTLQIK